MSCSMALNYLHVPGPAPFLWLISLYFFHTEHSPVKLNLFSHVPVASPCPAMLTVSPFVGLPLSISLSADSINLLRLRLGSTSYMKCSLISF